ncbi:hypothetical protein AC579_9883 [Pseudocercospora musae]|uniref:Uncharacterized protein n=1 Tax=Pseudocercospora musae TaxID=113226 RepID=A0A139IA56_9PEZI|nr:hypothetical protein AC579_9883 [Pseudocercospora musae]
MPIAVDRDRSVTSIEDEPRHENHNAESIPPWHQNRVVQMVQVPHLGSKAVALNGLETCSKPDLATDPYRSKKSTPQTAAMFGQPPAASPYETPLHIPNEPRTAPHVPAFVKAPPSPPDSLDRVSAQASGTTSTRQTSPETTERHVAPNIGLQGTMAHGEETYKRRQHSTRPS